MMKISGDASRKVVNLLVGGHLTPLLLHVLLDRGADGAVAALTLLMVL
jgi:hypothetical protein